MTMNRKITIIILTMLTLLPASVRSQGIDPTRAYIIEKYSNQAKKTQESQNKIMMLQATQHIWLEKELSETTNFMKQFNNYLDSIQDVLSIAAEIYGLYYEITKLSKNIGTLSSIVQDCPANVLAVAFSTRRNAVYRNIVKTGTDLVSDIKLLCFEGSKHTEAERENIMRGIRPKIKRINVQLRTLALAIKYTSFLDVWREITDRAQAYTPLTRREIVERSMRNWKDNVRRNRAQ